MTRNARTFAAVIRRSVPNSSAEIYSHTMRDESREAIEARIAALPAQFRAEPPTIEPEPAESPMLYGEVSVRVGTWHEADARTVDRSPSHYAADWETIRTIPGDVPLYVTFTGGYMVPMPYAATASVPAETLAGATYSGVGGVNFASREIQPGPTTYNIFLYTYMLAKAIEAGRVTLAPEFAVLGLADNLEAIDWARGQSYASIRALSEAAFPEAANMRRLSDLARGAEAYVRRHEVTIFYRLTLATYAILAGLIVWGMAQ